MITRLHGGPGVGLAIPDDLRLPFPIAVVGLDARRVSALEMVLAGPGENGYVVVATDDGARAVVLDLDSVGAEEQLAALRRRLPRRPLILVALRPVVPEILGPDVQLLKPIQVRALMDALAIVRSLARAWALNPPLVNPPVVVPPAPIPKPEPARAPAIVPGPAVLLPVVPAPAAPVVIIPAPAAPLGTAPASRARLFVVPDRPAPEGISGDPGDRAAEEPVPGPPLLVPVGDTSGPQLPSTHYDPVRYLQGLVTQACQAALARDQAVHVDGLWPTITLLPSTGTAIVTGGEAALAAHAGLPDLLSSARFTFTPAPRFSPNHPDAVPLDALLWQLALAASRGRLPAGTPVDQVCALREWPDFTRLAPAPGAMGIAALWTKEPLSLLSTAEVLRLPHSDVFTFFSGALALGLLVDEPEPAPPPARPAPTPAAAAAARPGLLRRALTKLRVG